ncbi:MAG: DNA mismatch repair protein MutS [Psychroflexus maritimus]
MTKNKFLVGDFVEWIDDVIKGQIVKISSEGIEVETTEGFLVKATPKQLIHTPKESITIDYTELNVQRAIDLQKEQKKRSKKRPKDKLPPPMEVDLHIEKLTDHWQNMSNFEILNLQLDTAKHKIEFAFKRRIKRVVLIHGVGEGVLKNEIDTLLRRFEHLDFYEADFYEYGKGATEVYFFEH